MKKPLSVHHVEILYPALWTKWLASKRPKLFSRQRSTHKRSVFRQYMWKGNLAVALLALGIVALFFLPQDEGLSDSEIVELENIAGMTGETINKSVSIADLTPEPSTILRSTVGRPPSSLSEGNIEWGDIQGNLIQSAYAGDTVNFFIRDGTFETIKSGTAVFTGLPAESSYFNIATGAVGPTLDIMTTMAVTRVLNADSYDTSNPSNTPLVQNPTAYRDDGSGIFVSSASLDDGIFRTISGVSPNQSKSVTASFNYHIIDVGTEHAVKVKSTSDPEGEWITIEEIEQYSLNPSATSQIFFGYVYLSPDELTNGSKNDGVWVQLGDTVTATYFGSTGIEVTTLTIK